MNEPQEAHAASGRGALSDQLEQRLREPDITIGALRDLLDERGFAIVLMLLMIPSALPIPTAGVTHVLEIFAALIAVQMIAGRRELWLPQRLARRKLGATFTGKAAPRMLRFIRWFERHSRQRLSRLLEKRISVAVLGVVLLVFVAGALVAPPFSGLDTLPSLGVVVLCLGLALSDGLVVGGGIVVGIIGLAVELALASVAWSFL